MSEPVELSQVREAQVTLERRLDSLVGQGIRSITVDELGALLAKAKAAKGSGNTPILAIRLDSATQERLEALAKRMSEEQPGLTFTRSAVIRVVLHRGLEEDEKKAKR